MKRGGLLVVLACCFAFCATLALAGCGASGQTKDDRTDFIWFKADMPDDCSVSSNASPATVGDVMFETPDGKISITGEEKSAEEEARYRPSEYPDKYTAGDDVTIGKHTWKVVNFDLEKPSVMLYTDLDGDEVKCAYVTAYNLDTNSEVLTSFLESIEFSSDIDKAYEEARSEKIADFRSRNGLS